MALRTVPVALEHARLVEREAPRAWFINFTNPAGLITQALQQHTKLRVVGICDTPAELLHRISHVLAEPAGDIQCEYAGLNHLGWVRRVLVRGQDVTARLLENPEALRELYHAELFDPLLIRTLKLIPSEYLFFYYSQRKALRTGHLAPDVVVLGHEAHEKIKFGAVDGLAYIGSSQVVDDDCRRQRREKIP